MEILVAGGTGFVGSSLCRELADRGHEVTALARDPTAADLPEEINRVAGDVTDYESVAAAVANQDVVVNLVSLSPLFDFSVEAHDRVTRQGTAHLVEAAESGEPTSFVYMSGLGADVSQATGFLRAKAAAESIVRDSSLSWTIVRPSVIFGEDGEFIPFVRMLTTPYLTALPGGGTTKFQPIWVTDVAGLLADAIEEDTFRGQAYNIGGPAQLSLAQITKLVHASDGRSTRIIPVPMALAALGLRIAGPLPFVPFGPDQARALRRDNTTDSNDVSAFGRPVESLLPFETYLGLEDASIES